MNKRTLTALVLAAFALFLLVGLAAELFEEGMDILADVVEYRIHARNNGERPAAAAEPTPPSTTVIPSDPVPMAPQPNPTEAVPPAATLTKEDAEAIALEYAGFTIEQVSRLRTEYEIDDGIPQYDVQFHEGRWEYEFEIHAETGNIISFEKDD